MWVLMGTCSCCLSWPCYCMLFVFWLQQVGVLHLKSYDSQYRLCANMIRELHCNYSLDDNFKDMIHTISCD